MFRSDFCGVPGSHLLPLSAIVDASSVHAGLAVAPDVLPIERGIYVDENAPCHNL